MKTIEERIGLCDDCLINKTRDCHTGCHLYSKYKGATEQRAIDEAELAEIKRQRDEYYDDLLSKRQRIAELEKEKASLMLEIHNKNKRIAELKAMEE